MNSRRHFLRSGAALAAIAPLAGCGLFDDDEKPILPGHREAVVPEEPGLELDPALAGLTVTVPPGEAPVDWPQPGRTPAHVLGSFAWDEPGDGRGSWKPAWEAKIGTGQVFRHVLTAPPIVADGRVYTMDADAVIDAFDLATGKRLWHLPTRPKKSTTSNVGGGIAYADGTIYAATGLAELLAVDATRGKIVWRVSTTTPVHSTPTVADGHVLYATIDDRLVAADIADGRTVWSYTATGSFNALLGQPAPATANGIVLAGFPSGELAAIKAVDGSTAWTDTLGGTVGASPLEFASIRAEPVIAGDTGYAVSVGGLMTATDMRTGRRIWERSISSGSTPVIAGDWMFVVSVSATVACLQLSSGHVRWTSVLPRFHNPLKKKEPIAWAGPLLVNGKLAVVSSYGSMTMLDVTDGSIIGERKLRGPASQVPIAVGGALLVLTDDGVLSAYK